RRVFAQQVYGVQAVSDQIASLSSREVLPQPGYTLYKGERVELTDAAIAKAIKDKRKAWKTAHPDAKPGAGPFPYRTTVLVRRGGAAVPQVLEGAFADGSPRTARFPGTRPWQRFTWPLHSRAVSARLDPHGAINLDADKLDDSRTLAPDRSVARRLTGQAASLLQTFYSLLVGL